MFAIIFCNIQLLNAILAGKRIRFSCTAFFLIIIAGYLLKKVICVYAFRARSGDRCVRLKSFPELSFEGGFFAWKWNGFLAEFLLFFSLIAEEFLNGLLKKSD